MYLSTQKYINQVESALTTNRRIHRYVTPSYPQEFDLALAELFGYIVQVGTVGVSTKECNFADCLTYPLIKERVIACYSEQWAGNGLRFNNYGHPRICGHRNIVFILAVCGNIQNLRPGYEKIPMFVYESYEQCEALQGKDVVKAFLKGLLGSAPKFKQLIVLPDKTSYNSVRIFFRSGKLFRETVSLLRYVLELRFTEDHGTLFFDEDQLLLLQNTLDLTDPSWWVK